MSAIAATAPALLLAGGLGLLLLLWRRPVAGPALAVVPVTDDPERPTPPARPLPVGSRR